MGITPGGPTAASFMSYGLARRFSSRRANFGKGEPEGIVAPETADHDRRNERDAADAGTRRAGLGGRHAVLLGGLMIWGLNPGPPLFTDRARPRIWGLIAQGMYRREPRRRRARALDGADVRGDPCASPVRDHRAADRRPSASSARTRSPGSRPDLLFVVLFGIAGYRVQEARLSYRAVRARDGARDKAEDAFRQSMIMAKGSLAIFWSNPLVANAHRTRPAAICSGRSVARGLRLIMPRRPIDAFEE
jgi:TctA family transporter